MTSQYDKRLVHALERIGKELGEINKTLSSRGCDACAKDILANLIRDAHCDSCSGGRELETRTDYSNRVFGIQSSDEHLDGAS